MAEAIKYGLYVLFLTTGNLKLQPEGKSWNSSRPSQEGEHQLEG